MSTQPIPEPLPLATGPFDPGRAQPAPARRPQCRALTVDGHRCKNHVLGGLHLCFSHYRNRHPALPDPSHVSVPLLEDRSAVQLMATQILHGILSRRLDPLTARAALAALRVAALTLPRPAAPARSQPAAAPPDDAVCRLARDHEDFISADGDLAEPELNPSCSVPESVEAVRELLDTLEPQNHCLPEDRPAERPRLDPSHDFERCPCCTCTGYRQWAAQVLANDRLAGAIE
jgi:hypothetical protein